MVAINVFSTKKFRMKYLTYFPDSKYAKDSQQKIILLKENIAAKHMNIGMFYLNQKKYLAAYEKISKSN